MGTSYVEYNNFGFWSHDKLLSATLFLIQKHLPEDDESELIKELKINLFDASTAGYVGCIPNCIEDFDSVEKLDFLRSAILKAIDDINNNESELVEEFEKNQVGGYFWNSIPKKEIIKNAKLILNLVNGELKNDALGEIDD